MYSVLFTCKRQSTDLRKPVNTGLRFMCIKKYKKNAWLTCHGRAASVVPWPTHLVERTLQPEVQFKWSRIQIIWIRIQSSIKLTPDPTIEKKGENGSEFDPQ